MSLDLAATMLSEFHYRLNGREKTIKFLIYILNELVNGEGK